MDDRTVYEGRSRTIEFAELPNGTIPGLKAWRKLDVRPRAQLLVTIKRLGDYGQVRNEERFKIEKDGIYAIKAWQVRAYCFMTSDARIVVTSIVEKKQNRARPEDLRRAGEIRAECLNG